MTTTKTLGLGLGSIFQTTDAQDVCVGDTVIWNEGYTSEVVNIAPKGKKSLLITTRAIRDLSRKASETEHDRTIRKSSWMIVLGNQTEETQKMMRVMWEIQDKLDEHVEAKIDEITEGGTKPLFRSTRFRHKTTGEIATVIPIMQMNEYEKLDD